MADRSLRVLRLRCSLRHLLPSRGQGSPLKAQWWTKYLLLPRYPYCWSHFWNHISRKSISLFFLRNFLFAHLMSLFHILVDDLIQCLLCTSGGKLFFWTSQDPSWMGSFYFILYKYIIIFHQGVQFEFYQIKWL